VPEGDTILRSADTLRRWLLDRQITSARTTLPGLRAARLRGATVTGVDARGKHLLLRLSSGDVLHTHMGMTGSWHVYPTGERWRRPAREARLVLEAGERLAVCFNAPVVELLAAHQERVHPVLAALGPDVLDPRWGDAEVVRRRARQRALDGVSPTAAELLLDQRIVSGVGNIYRSETLFVCGIDPWHPVASLSDEQIDDLVGAASRLMSSSVRHGTVAARGFGGRAGQAWVYRRAGLRCRRCGTSIVARRIGTQARTVYWCPTCQPPAAEVGRGGVSG